MRNQIFYLLYINALRCTHLHNVTRVKLFHALAFTVEQQTRKASYVIAHYAAPFGTGKGGIDKGVGV